MRTCWSVMSFTPGSLEVVGEVGAVGKCRAVRRARRRDSVGRVVSGAWFGRVLGARSDRVLSVWVLGARWSGRAVEPSHRGGRFGRVVRPCGSGGGRTPVGQRNATGPCEQLRQRAGLRQGPVDAEGGRVQQPLGHGDAPAPPVAPDPSAGPCRPRTNASASSGSPSMSTSRTTRSSRWNTVAPDRVVRCLRRGRVLAGQQPGQFRTGARADRVEQRDALRATRVRLVGERHVVDGRHGGPGEEPPGVPGVAEVPLCSRYGLRASSTGRTAAAGRRGAGRSAGRPAPPRLVRPGCRAGTPRCGAAGRSRRRGRPAARQPASSRATSSTAGPHGEGQGRAARRCSRSGERPAAAHRRRRTGAVHRRSPQDAVGAGVGVADVVLQRSTVSQVLFALLTQARKGSALSHSLSEPLGGIVHRLAQLVAHMSRNGGDPVADAVVGVQELLLHSVVDVQHQDDPHAGSVERGYRHADRVPRPRRPIPPWRLWRLWSGHLPTRYPSLRRERPSSGPPLLRELPRGLGRSSRRAPLLRRGAAVAVSTIVSRARGDREPGG